MKKSRSTGKCSLRRHEHGHGKSVEPEAIPMRTEEAEYRDKFWAQSPGFRVWPVVQRRQEAGSADLQQQNPRLPNGHNEGLAKQNRTKSNNNTNQSCSRLSQAAMKNILEKKNHSRAIPAKWLKSCYFSRPSFPICKMGRLIKQHKENLYIKHQGQRLIKPLRGHSGCCFHDF